jgi:hypothetical protein
VEAPLNSEMFLSPSKPTSSEKEYFSPVIDTSSLLCVHETRIATLTPGPVYYPEDSHSRRTPGIDRPNQIRSMGAFEHSVNFEGKGVLPYFELDSDLNYDDPINIPTPQNSFSYVTEMTPQSPDRGEFVSPGKNPHSRPFVPQQYLDLEPYGGSRSDLTERVPPLRQSRYSWSDIEIHHQNNQPPQLLRPSAGNCSSISSLTLISVDSSQRIPDRTRVPIHQPIRSQNQTFEYTKPYPSYNQQRQRMHGSYYRNYINEYQSKDGLDSNFPFQPQLQEKTADFQSQDFRPNNYDPHINSFQRSSSPKSRSELVESPGSKSAYKIFLKKFKTKEGESFAEAMTYALSELPKIPEKVRWRAYIDIADTLKRNSHYGDVSLPPPLPFPSPVPLIFVPYLIVGEIILSKSL